MGDIAKVEKELKRWLKSTSISFTMATLVGFMISGQIFATEEVQLSRPEIKGEIKKNIQKIDKIERENFTGLERINISILQLLEQGEQVIKPWDHSWQFGVNWWWLRDHGDAYKYYPYARRYDRTEDVFARTLNVRMHSQIKNDNPYYENFKDKILRKTAENPNNSTSKIEDKNGFLNIGVSYATGTPVYISAQIEPKSIDKKIPKLEVPKIEPFEVEKIDIEPVTNDIVSPEIKIKGFSPIAPKAVEPVVPEPPSLTFLAYPDNNFERSMLVHSNSNKEFMEQWKKREKIELKNNPEEIKKVTDNIAKNELRKEYIKKNPTWYKEQEKLINEKVKNDPQVKNEIDRVGKEARDFYTAYIKKRQLPMRLKIRMIKNYVTSEVKKAEERIKEEMIDRKIIAIDSNYYKTGIERQDIKEKIKNMLDNELEKIFAEKQKFFSLCKNSNYHVAGEYQNNPSEGIGKEEFFILHNTWPKNDSFGKDGLFFKTFAIDAATELLTPEQYLGEKDADNTKYTKNIKIDSFNPTAYNGGENSQKPPIMASGWVADRQDMPHSAPIVTIDDKVKDEHEKKVLEILTKSRNSQYFFVGGSRGIEFDSTNGEHKVPEDVTVNMAGPLVFGIVKQEKDPKIISAATITDKNEKDEEYIKNMPVDQNGYLLNQYVIRTFGKEITEEGNPNKFKLEEKVEHGYIVIDKDKKIDIRSEKSDILPTDTPILVGPRYNIRKNKVSGQDDFSTYEIKKSKDGYIGYKIGLGHIEESETSSEALVANEGIIDIRGRKSIGLMAYLPYQMDLEAPIINEKSGKIYMSGENSYGMKYSAVEPTEDNKNLKFANEGSIELRRNPDGEDRADNAVAFALTVDKGMNRGRKVSLSKDKGTNSGTITLKDNINNSIGMYVNIASHLTNTATGIINIDAQTTEKSALNMGMYAKQVEKENVGNIYREEKTFNTEVINDGTINMSGYSAIGMVASEETMDGNNIFGHAIATNNGTIHTFVKDDLKATSLYGMIGDKKGEIINNGTITLEGKENNVGMYVIGLTDGEVPQERFKFSKGTNHGKIIVDAPSSAGIFNRGNFVMENENAKVEVNGNASIGIYAKGKYEIDKDNPLTPEGKENGKLLYTDDVKTEIKSGEISSTNGGIAIYADDAIITLDNSSNNLKLSTGDNGLLFYNYASEDTSKARGKIKLATDIDATIDTEGTAFYFKNAKITAGASEYNVGGVSEFLNSMFADSGNNKLKLKLKNKSTFMVLDRPDQEEAIPISKLKFSTTTFGDKVEVTAEPNTAYKIYVVNRGQLMLDKGEGESETIYDYDDVNNPINKQEFLSSKVIIGENTKVIGKQPGQIGALQTNYADVDDVGRLEDVFIKNYGKIVLPSDSVKGNGVETSKTTTGIAGNYIGILNSSNAEIDVTGKDAIGIYGVGGSKIENEGKIVVGENGVGIYSQNRGYKSSLGDGVIRVTNSGTIKVDKDGAVGIYAKNIEGKDVDREESSVINKGIIDLANSKKSKGIMVTGVNYVGTSGAKVSVGDKSSAIIVNDGEIDDSTSITLTNDSNAYVLSGVFEKPIKLNGTVSLNGNKNNIIYVNNATFKNIVDDVTINSQDKYDYIKGVNSDITYDTDKTFTRDNLKFVSLNNSKVNIKANISMTGDNVRAISLMEEANSVPSAPTLTPSLTFEAGKKISVSGKKAVAVYIQNGMENISGDIEVEGENSFGIYTIGEKNELHFAGNLLLKDGARGINFEGGKFKDGSSEMASELSGKITSTSNKTKGLIIGNQKSAPMDVKIDTEFNMTGDKNIAIYVQNNKSDLNLKVNSGISIGDTPKNDKELNVGLYAIDADKTKVVYNGKINVGKNSVGIAVNNLETTKDSIINVDSLGVGVYTDGETNNSGKIVLNGNLKLVDGIVDNRKEEDTIGLYSNAPNKQIELGQDFNLELGKHSIGVALKGDNSTFVSDAQNILLPGDSVFVYSVDPKGSITNNTSISMSGSDNVAFYVGGSIINNGNIDMSNSYGSVGIFTNSKDKEAINRGKITTGYVQSIGMATGGEEGSVIINEGIINVNNEKSIGMLVAENGKGVNKGTINVTGKSGIGIYISSNGSVENRGDITVTGEDASAIYIERDGIFKNYGNIVIGKDSVGIKYKDSDDKTLEDFNEEPGKITGEGLLFDKTIQGLGLKKNQQLQREFNNINITVDNDGVVTVKVDGHKVDPLNVDINEIKAHPDIKVGTEIVKNLQVVGIFKDVTGDHEVKSLAEATEIGMYIDTSGINFTKPIEGLSNLKKLTQADLIVGSEATYVTNAKVIEVGDNIMEPYGKAMRDNAQFRRWNVTSAALTWKAEPKNIDEDGIIKGMVLVKVPYTDSLDKGVNEYNFLDGLEQRYDANSIYSREKVLFNKLNSIGQNEEILYKQAIYEMLGYQYVNTSRRLQDTRKLYDREFNELMDWKTITKDTTKVKVFGESKQFRGNKLGTISYDREAKGVMVLNNNETVRLGYTKGWFYGLSYDSYAFKDLGKSKEKALTGEIGYHIAESYGYNRESNYLLKVGLEGSYRKMNRRYLVVDDIFQGKSRYYTYGPFAQFEYSREYRATEKLKIEPKVGIDLGIQRVGKIHERSGEVRLDVKSHNSYTLEPKAHLVFTHTNPLSKGELISKVDFGVSHNYGLNGEKAQRARVAYTSADTYGLPKDKVKTDVDVLGKITLERDDYGIGVMAGYNFNQKTKIYGVEGKIKF